MVKYSVYQLVSVVGLYRLVADNLTWEQAIEIANRYGNSTIKKCVFNAATHRYETMPCISLISENYYRGGNL